MLVTSAIRAGDAVARGLGNEQIWLYGEEKANEAFQRLCIEPLTGTVGKVPLTKVSGMCHRSLESFSGTSDSSRPFLQGKPRYKDTIKQLIEATDREIQQHMHDSSHTTPTSLAWAIAQRGNADINIEASVA